MLRTYRICNPTVRFSKYEFNNKLLGGVILLGVILSFKFIQFKLLSNFVENLSLSMQLTNKKINFLKRNSHKKSIKYFY